MTSLAHEAVFGEASSACDRSSTGTTSACVVFFSGREAVLAQAAMLEDLAGRCEQPGAMHGLDYLIHHEYSARKTPHLLCLFASDGDPRPYGAVLLFEYRVGPWSTGFYSTGDPFGVRTVVGPAPLRAWIAEQACSALLRQRAGMVMTSFKQEPEPQVLPHTHEHSPAEPACLWATQTRHVQDHLPLAPTVDATLGRLGKRTRTHLRYYRRRLQDAVPCDFMADVTSLIAPENAALLERLNQSSLEPVAQEIFNLQYRSTALAPDGFVSGLRSREGQWLALVGGWRQGGTTWVQWQTNTAAFPVLSLGTALRLFLIEQEVGRGATTLAFHGGTSHSMRHAFPEEHVVDRIARRGPLAALLVRAIPAVRRVFPSVATRGNFLADALGSPGLRWTSTKP